MFPFSQIPLYRRPGPSLAAVSRVVTAPTGLALDLAATKLFLGMISADTSRDAEVTGLIRAATAMVERHCQISILDTIWQINFSKFYDAMAITAARPFVTILDVDYVRDDGQIITVDHATYTASFNPQLIGAIHIGDDFSWPDDVANRRDAVRLKVRAGFGTTAAEVPDDIRHALEMIVVYLNANRGDCDCSSTTGGNVTITVDKSTFSAPAAVPAMPKGAIALLAPYRYRSITVI
jgi:uncharacterized phiE125 gp8 family phage protein